MNMLVSDATAQPRSIWRLIDELGRRQRVEFRCEDLRIGAGYPKDQQRARVAEHGGADI